MPPSQADRTAVVDGWHAEHASDLQLFLWGLLRDWPSASDASQAVFRKAIESFEQVDPQHVRGWLFRVAYHEAMWLKRKQGVHRRAVEELTRRSSSVATNPTSSLDELIKQEELSRLQAAIQELPHEQRALVQRRLLHDETFAQIAAATETPLGTVLTRMRLAMEKLKRAFKDAPTATLLAPSNTGAASKHDAPSESRPT